MTSQTMLMELLMQCSRLANADPLHRLNSGCRNAAFFIPIAKPIYELVYQCKYNNRSNP